MSALVLNSGGEQNGTLGVLASSHRPAVLGGSDSWQAAVLIYSSDDNRTSSRTEDVTVTLKGLAEHEGTFDQRQLKEGPLIQPHSLFVCLFVCCPDLVYVTYYMDNNVTNSYQLWQSMGRPNYPTAEQFRRLRSVEVRY